MLNRQGLVASDAHWRLLTAFHTKRVGEPCMTNMQSGEDRLLLAVGATPWQGGMAVRLDLEELIVLLLLPFVLPFPLYIAQNPRFQVRKLGFQISVLVF